MRAGEIFEQEAEFSQTFPRHEMGVINDGDEHLSGLMDLEGLLNEEAFAVMILSVELDLKGLAKDAQDVVIGVEGSIEHWSDNALGIMVD